MEPSHWRDTSSILTLLNLFLDSKKAEIYISALAVDSLLINKHTQELSLNLTRSKEQLQTISNRKVTSFTRNEQGGNGKSTTSKRNSIKQIYFMLTVISSQRSAFHSLIVQIGILSNIPRNTMNRMKKYSLSTTKWELFNGKPASSIIGVRKDAFLNNWRKD